MLLPGACIPRQVLMSGLDKEHFHGDVIFASSTTQCFAIRSNFHWCFANCTFCCHVHRLRSIRRHQEVIVECGRVLNFHYSIVVVYIPCYYQEIIVSPFYWNLIIPLSFLLNFDYLDVNLYSSFGCRVRLSPSHFQRDYSKVKKTFHSVFIECNFFSSQYSVLRDQ